MYPGESMIHTSIHGFRLVSSCLHLTHSRENYEFKVNKVSVIFILCSQ